MRSVPSIMPGSINRRTRARTSIREPAIGRIRRPPASKGQPDRWQKINSLSTLVSSLSVLILAASLFVTYRDNQEQRRLDRAAQITERFSKAVEQLGSSKVDVRLGGIYSLERIMKDSQSDRSTVVEVLSAYIREHAGRMMVDRGRPPTADIQGALTVLGRRPDPSRVFPDLSHANLSRADLTDANLTGADLTGANLRSANLDRANLTRANLQVAQLGSATFAGANLTDANLDSAYLDSTYMPGANLARANLTQLDLSRAYLVGANLDGANLTRATLPRPEQR